MKTDRQVKDFRRVGILFVSIIRKIAIQFKQTCCFLCYRYVHVTQSCAVLNVIPLFYSNIISKAKDPVKEIFHNLALVSENMQSFSLHSLRAALRRLFLQ